MLQGYIYWFISLYCIFIYGFVLEVMELLCLEFCLVLVETCEENIRHLIWRVDMSYRKGNFYLSYDQS